MIFLSISLCFANSHLRHWEIWAGNLASDFHQCKYRGGCWQMVAWSYCGLCQWSAESTKNCTTSNHNNIFFIEYIQIPVYTFINIILLHTCIVEIKELNNVFISLRIFTIIYSMNFFCKCYSQYVELQNSEYWYMYSFACIF